MVITEYSFKSQKGAVINTKVQVQCFVKFVKSVWVKSVIESSSLDANKSIAAKWFQTIKNYSPLIQDSKLITSNNNENASNSAATHKKKKLKKNEVAHRKLEATTNQQSNIAVDATNKSSSNVNATTSNEPIKPVVTSVSSLFSAFEFLPKIRNLPLFQILILMLLSYLFISNLQLSNQMQTQNSQLAEQQELIGNLKYNVFYLAKTIESLTDNSDVKQDLQHFVSTGSGTGILLFEFEKKLNDIQDVLNSQRKVVSQMKRQQYEQPTDQSRKNAKTDL